MAYISDAEKACNQFKHAIATNSGVFYDLTERRMSDSDHPAMMIVPDGGVYENGKGWNPKKVRYSAAPTIRTRYANIEHSGTEAATMTGKNCAGNPEDIETTANSLGQCNLPKGRQLQFGYDVFGREMKGLAWETDPFCAFSLIHQGQDHVKAWFDMLYREFPKIGMEDFERELQMSIIDVGRNWAATDGALHISQGGFEQDATSMVMLPHLQRHMRILRGEGWPKNEPIVYCVSIEVAETILEQHKKRNRQGALDAQHHINYTPHGKDDMHLKGGEIIRVGGVTLKVVEMPVKVVRNPNTGELRVIEPYVTRAGTGGGIVWEYNEAYDECQYVCADFGPDALPVQELIFYGSRTAMKRYKMGKFQLPGQKEVLGSNFELKVLDGAHIDCNPNNEKMALYLQHRWVLEALNPELVGGILSLWAQSCIYTYNPCCDESVDPNSIVDSFGLAGGLNPLSSDCYSGQCEPCNDTETLVDPLPEAGDLCGTGESSLPCNEEILGASTPLDTDTTP